MWVGPDFSETIRWAQCFLLVPVFACLGVGANVCKAAGGVRLVNSLATGKIILNLVVSIALIKPLGVGGPILGTVISNLVLGDMAFFTLYCRRTGIGSIQGYRYFFQILFVALIAGSIAWFGLQWIEAGGFLGLAVKAVCSVLVQVICMGVFCFSRDEKIWAVNKVMGMVGR